MEITSLKCNHCGANLQIDPKVKFFNCTFCGSSLTIKKSGNVMFTEVLDEIKEDTETLIGNSEVMLLEKEIARLDREWLLEREQYKINGGNGNDFYPDESSSLNILMIVLYALAMIFGMSFIFSKMPTSQSPPFVVYFFPIIILGVLIFQVFSQNSKKEKYAAAKQAYTNNRQELLNQVEQKKKNG